MFDVSSRGNDWCDGAVLECGYRVGWFDIV